MEVTKIFLVFSFIAAIRAGEGEKLCPRVHFLEIDLDPEIGIPIEKDCAFSHNCAKVKCEAKVSGHKLTMSAELKKCDEHLMLAVTLKEPQSDLDWSHTLRDGEKAKLPYKPKSFSGGYNPVSHASLFIKVGIKKSNGSNFNYTVALVGQVTVFGETSHINFVLLQGKSPSFSTGDCGSWFSRQPGYIKGLVIGIPLFILVLVGIVVAVWCYRRRREGLTFTIGKSRVPMQQLINEI